MSKTRNWTELVTPIVLHYDEPGWTEKTVECLRAAGYEENIIYADRGGVGSISKAFNRAQMDLIDAKPYIWWLSNVTFKPDLPQTLVDFMEKNLNYAAIHPAFDSDHPFLNNVPDPFVRVPFVEWTAPLIRQMALVCFSVGYLDEQMPYFGMDIDWSYRATQNGWMLAVCQKRLEHQYLRFVNPKHPISEIREALRAYHASFTYARLEEKWGMDWRAKLCPGGNC